MIWNLKIETRSQLQFVTKTFGRRSLTQNDVAKLRRKVYRGSNVLLSRKTCSVVPKCQTSVTVMKHFWKSKASSKDYWLEPSLRSWSSGPAGIELWGPKNRLSRVKCHEGKWRPADQLSGWSWQVAGSNPTPMANKNFLTLKALIAVIFLLIGLQYLSLLQVNEKRRGPR